MMEKPNRPQRNRRHSRRAWPPEDDLHYPRAAKRLFTPEIKRMLKEWLVRRRENPYPSRDEKKRLAIDTGLTYTQICNWFANWRRKLKNAEREKSKKSWGHLIKNYNTNAKGNVEQFSISSEDSIWEEEEQQYRRHHHHRSDNENEDDDLDSMCDIDGSSGGSTDTTERNGTGSSTISSGFGGEEGGIHMTGVNHKTNIYNINNAMALHKDPSELFIGREVDVLTTNASCQITQSAANVGTKTKYKQKMMEKYLRDTYDTNSTPINSTMVHIGFNDQQTSTDNPQHATATVYCNGSNTTIIKSGAELSKWLESAAKFTPNKNNYFIEWNSKRNKNDKKPLLVTTTTKSFPVSNPNNGDAQQTSVTVVPILYSTTPASVQITNSPNTTNSHLQQQQQQQQQFQLHIPENEHIYNSIHHKDELDAAEALANLAFNCRQRMLDANVTAGCTFQRPLNAISS